MSHQPPAVHYRSVEVWQDEAPFPAARTVRPGVTAALVCAMFLLLLFLAQVGGLGAALAMGLAGVLAVIERRKLHRLLLGGRALVLVIPLLCLASALWSEDAGVTFRYGVEMLATVVAGLVLSLSDRPGEVLVGVFVAFAIYAATALVFGHTMGVGTRWQAFTGLNQGKNYMAEIAATGALFSLTVPALALQSGRPIWIALALAALPVLALQLFILSAARSAGAMVALGVGVGLLALLLTVSRLPKAWRWSVTGFGGIFLLLTGLFRNQLAAQISEAAVQAFHKDPTLTGRTYLWYRAQMMIDEKPVLGHGFYVFWRWGNPDAEGLWQYAGIDSRSGFNFHNTGIETLMQFGWSGAVILAVTLTAAAIALVCRFAVRPTVVTAVWLSLCGFELVRSFYESIGPMPFYFSNVLLAAALGSAFRPATTASAEGFAR
jgi:exopolysaccharide production protein ExoQ